MRLPAALPIAVTLALALPAHADSVDRRADRKDQAAAEANGLLPGVWATRSPDGSWLLVLAPAGGWNSAELSVRGSDSVDLGPVRGGDQVRVEGQGEAGGPLHVTLQATTGEGAGVTWRFAVDPESVPVRSPTSDRAPGRAGRWRGLLRGGR